MDDVARAWTPVLTEDGTYSLASPEHGEACHSRCGAWLESRVRYAQACKLRERALARETGATLRVLDVGTGLGLNLAAALEALDGTGVVLEAVSLEIDVRVFAATLALPSVDRDVERWHAPVRASLERVLDQPAQRDHTLECGGGSVRILVGDARETLRALDFAWPFDAVFLDAFSPRVDERLWSFEFLGEVARRCASGAWLSTYTSAVRVRAALIAHGLHVGPGARLGSKSSGTIAGRDREVPAFDARTAQRLLKRARMLREEVGNPLPIQASERTMS